MKFLIPTSVDKVKGNQREVKCYAFTIKWNEYSEIVHMMEITQWALKLVESRLALDKAIGPESRDN